MGSCLKKSRNSTVVNKKKIVKPEGQHILVIKKKYIYIKRDYMAL